MSADVHALEQHLLEHRDDDEAWKVYADALLARGDRLGEAISLEIAAAERPDPALDAALAALYAEHPELRAWDYEPEDWLDDDFEHMPVTTPGFFRGCIWSARVTDIRKPSSLRWLAKLLADPRARFVCELELVFDNWEAEAAELTPALEQLDLAALRHLRVADHRLGDPLALALAAQPRLALRSLDLRYAALTDAGARALASTAQLRGLRSLHLQRNEIGPEGLEALASCPALAELELLDLRYNPIGGIGAAHLAKSSTPSKLRTLLFHAADLDDDGVQALASSTTLPRDLVRLWRGQAQVRAR